MSLNVRPDWHERFGNAKPFGVNKGKNFRLKKLIGTIHLNPSVETDKPRAQQAFTNGITIEVHRRP